MRVVVAIHSPWGGQLYALTVNLIFTEKSFHGVLLFIVRTCNPLHRSISHVPVGRSLFSCEQVSRSTTDPYLFPFIASSFAMCLSAVSFDGC